MVIIIFYLDGNVTKYYSLLNEKVRKINSVKKVFESLKFFDFPKNSKQAFKVYMDKDVGFSFEWQKKLKKAVYYFKLGYR